MCKATVEEEIKKKIALFENHVKRSFLKITNDLLVSKSVDTIKIMEINERQVEIVNTCCLVN